MHSGWWVELKRWEVRSYWAYVMCSGDMQQQRRVVGRPRHAWGIKSPFHDDMCACLLLYRD